MNEIKRVVVAGAGGVGFWLVASLSKAIDTRILHVFDDDTLVGGMGHARLPAASLQTRKVDLLKGFLLVSLGVNPPTMHFARVTGDEAELDGETLVIDACDMALDSRKILWEKVRAKGCRIIRVSYDGKNSVVVVAEGLPFVSSIRGGYSEVPSTALSFAAGGIGAEVVRHVLDGKLPNHIEFQVSINALAGIVPEAPVTVAVESAVLLRAPRRKRAA